MSEDSLKQSMDSAVKRYSSLFRLPSTRRVLLSLAVFCVGGGLLSSLIIFPSLGGFVDGLLLGFALFGISLIVDYFISTLVLKGSTIFDFRRTMALSFFCWTSWAFFILVGVAVGVVFGFWPWGVRLCFLGCSAAMILRLLVFSSTSSMSRKRLLLASFAQPFLCLIPFVTFWILAGLSTSFRLSLYIFLPMFFFLSLAVSIVSTSSFLGLLNNVGKETLGVQSLSLFRAFMLNWVLGLNAPFEEKLEALGENKEVETSLMKFSSSSPKAVMIVPSVHPGPFKNIGSSLLPSMLKYDLEKEFGCVTCVPHGLLGHEFDLASQLQNRKVIAEVVAALKGVGTCEANASPFVKVSNGSATACCQVFGKLAFISFTLAPKTIEDLPQELGLFVRQEAERHSLRLCAVVNAHNSIDGTANMEESLSALKDVATECLGVAATLKQSPFEVGAATLLPKDFSLEDGMGSGGITVIVIRSGRQKAAYVTIDGNNLVSGLREKILSSLNSIGIDEGEVFTTDTHAVSALVLSRYGYHPVGEVMDTEKLVECIKEATVSAMARLESSRVSCRTITISDVKVIGEKQLEALCLLIDRSIKTAKRIVAPIFGISGLLLTLFLLLT